MVSDIGVILPSGCSKLAEITLDSNMYSSINVTNEVEAVLSNASPKYVCETIAKEISGTKIKTKSKSASWNEVFLENDGKQ